MTIVTRFSQAEDLSERLLDHLDSLVPILFPGAYCDSSYWYIGSVYGESGDSLKINRRGAWRGSWKDWASGPNHCGDLLDLVCQTLCNGKMPSAMDWARDYLGLSPNPPVIDRADLERRRVEREAQAAAEDEEKIDKARALWRHGQPIDGTPAERYLRNRAISLDLPPTLRFTNIWNPEAGVPLPCLLAAISGPDKQVCAVQRIYLCDDGSGKAEVENPKLTLGKLLNGACRLAPAGPVLGLAEGLETGMSAMAMYQVPVWVACGSRLDQVAIPDMVERLVIFGDRGGEHIALKAAAAHERPGRKITIVYPPEPHKDFNDVLQAKLRVAA